MSADSTGRAGRIRLFVFFYHEKSRVRYFRRESFMARQHFRRCEQLLVRDSGHLVIIRRAVVDTHKARIVATELLNMHLRRTLSDPEVV